MAYEQKPNTGTLWENERKQSESHPDYRGNLLISSELLQKISQQGEAKIEISAWIGQTKDGKPRISITCKEPYAKNTESQLTPEQGAAKRLQQLKEKLAAISTLDAFEELYNKVVSESVWNQFTVVPAIAQEAADMLSTKKSELVLADKSNSFLDVDDIPF